MKAFFTITALLCFGVCIGQKITTEEQFNQSLKAFTSKTTNSHSYTFEDKIPENKRFILSLKPFGEAVFYKIKTVYYDRLDNNVGEELITTPWMKLPAHDREKVAFMVSPNAKYAEYARITVTVWR